jgi:hypothetical protein
MSPGRSRSMRRPPNRTRLPPGHGPESRPAWAGTPRARRCHPCRHPRPGAVRRHRDPVPTVRGRNGRKALVLAPPRPRDPVPRQAPPRGRQAPPPGRPELPPPGRQAPPRGRLARPGRPARQGPPLPPPARHLRSLANPASKSPFPAGRSPGPGGLTGPGIHGGALRPKNQNARGRIPAAASPRPRAGRPSASGCGAEGHTGADPAGAGYSAVGSGGRTPDFS